MGDVIGHSVGAPRGWSAGRFKMPELSIILPRLAIKSLIISSAEEHDHLPFTVVDHSVVLTLGWATLIRVLGPIATIPFPRLSAVSLAKGTAKEHSQVSATVVPHGGVEPWARTVLRSFLRPCAAVRSFRQKSHRKKPNQPFCFSHGPCQKLHKHSLPHDSMIHSSTPTTVSLPRLAVVHHGVASTRRRTCTRVPTVAH